MTNENDILRKYAIIRAIKTILTQPNKRFSIVGLANEAKMAPSAASYSLDYMVDNNIVNKQIIGNTHQYQANLENCVTRQWKILFSIQEIKKTRIVDEILKKTKNVSSIVLYGSIASGTDDDRSDWDILVIADTKRTSEMFGRTAIEGREINMQIYTPVEWRKKAHEQKAFYDNVVLHSIPLYGDKPVIL